MGWGGREMLSSPKFFSSTMWTCLFIHVFTKHTYLAMLSFFFFFFFFRAKEGPVIFFWKKSLSKAGCMTGLSKQCSHRSDTAECAILSGLTLFATPANVWILRVKTVYHLPILNFRLRFLVTICTLYLLCLGISSLLCESMIGVLCQWYHRFFIESASDS